MNQTSTKSDRFDDIDAIMAGLRSGDRLPREAMQAALAHWDEVAPVFLATLQDYLQDPDAQRDDEDALFFLIHLSGQMRDTRAYRPLMALCAREGEADLVLGDALTSTLLQVAAGVFDGDPGPMKAVILDGKADQFTRSRLLETFAFLAGDGRIDLDDASAFLDECHDRLKQQDHDRITWDGWIDAISYLGLVEMEDLVRTAFEENGIGVFIDLPEFEQDLEQVLSGGRDALAEQRGYGYLADAIEELSSWAGFSQGFGSEPGGSGELIELDSDEWEPSDEPGDIVSGLRRRGRLPREAMQAALEHWDEVAPVFLATLQGYLQDPDAHRDDEDALFFLVHLSGQMQDTRAYRPLMALCAREDEAELVLGDALSSTLLQVVAGVFDGDPGPMKAVILDGKADEFARSRLLETFAFLTGDGRIDLDDARAFLRECHDRLKQQDHDGIIWDGWLCAISYLGLAEMKDLVRTAFEQDGIGVFIDLPDFEQDLEQVLSGGRDALAEQREYGYLADAIEELSAWDAFSVENRDALGWLTEPEDDLIPPENVSYPSGPPVTNPYRHVGRNDPCPCGSGKKFKKCCLGKV